jgi:hypothetical protein
MESGDIALNKKLTVLPTYRQSFLINFNLSIIETGIE